jgi:hypothetical protein
MKLWGLVAHACNLSYSGGRDQEDRGSMTTGANSLWDLTLKKSNMKKNWWSGSRCRHWVQTPVLQKKKKPNSKLDFINIKTFCSSKDTIKWENANHRLEKIATYIFENSPVNHKKKHLIKMGKGFSIHFTLEEMGMTNTHMKNAQDYQWPGICTMGKI